MRILILITLIGLISCGNKKTGPEGPSDEKVSAFVQALNDNYTVQKAEMVKQYTERGGEWVIIKVTDLQGRYPMYLPMNLEYFSIGDIMSNYYSKSGAAYNTMNATVVTEQDKLGLWAAFPLVWIQSLVPVEENGITLYRPYDSDLNWLVSEYSELDPVYVRSELEKAFTFSQELDSSKDLESFGQKVEQGEIDQIQDRLVNHGLSTERSQKVAKIANHFSKISSQRALTSREKDLFTQELTGLSFDEAAAEMVEDYEGLIKKAAKLNETGPEAIKELINTIM